MPIVDKRDRNNWYNSVPVYDPLKGNPLMDPNFSIEKMEGNELNFGGKSIVAKIPEIKGRIFRDNKSGNGTSIVLLTDRYPDPDNPGRIRHERVVIGTELFGRFAGLMAANDKYHEYFDTNGNLVYDPLTRRKEREAREAEKKAAKEAAEEAQRKAAKEGRKEAERKTQSPKAAAKQEEHQETGRTEKKTDIAEKERTVDEIRESLLKKEKLLKQQLQELAQKQQEADEKLQQLEEAQEELDSLIEERKYEMQERAAAHLSLLDNILDSHFTTVKEQAKRRPDALMRLTQIRTINEILKELREWFAGTEAEDYLHLADEPREDDLEHHPGTTYGEMAILLSAYTHTIFAVRFRKLYWKQGTPVTPEEDEDGEEEEEDET